MNIVLVGFMCAGKTTVGESIAVLTGRPFVDTDNVLERERGMKVSEIFAADTEAGFRDLERDVVGRVAREDGIVIALGGGAVLDPRNVEDAKRGGVIYYLEVTPEEVASRSEGTGVRPLLEGKGTGDIARLMEGRERYYLEAADVTVAAAGRDPGEVASEIISDFEARTLVDDDS